jgi:fibronectin-binding autotransporter adhesin
LNALVLDGGTLSSVASDATYGSWSLDYGVSTPGDGSTSYITGGNLSLTEIGGTVFNVGAGDTLNVSSVIAHTTDAADTGLIKSGPGMMVLSGSNTYTGGTTVDDGTLVVQSPDSLLNGSSLFVGDSALLDQFDARAPIKQSLVAVPEPGTAALLLVAGLLLLYRWRR